MATTIEINKPEKNITTAIYALQGLHFFFGVTILIAVVLNYIKRDDVRGSWLESHFRWQIRTFWFWLLWTFLGALTLMLGVGAFILLANSVWLIYRIVKGWLRLSEGKIMYPAP